MDSSEPPEPPETPQKHGRLRDLIRSWRSSPSEHRRLALRVWFAEHLQLNDMQRTLLWAGLVGVLGGLVSVAFRQATDWIHLMLTNQTGGMVESFSKLPAWQRILTPALGGALAGIVILFGKRLGRSRNTTDYMEAVVLGNGTVSFRSSLVKTVSAMFSVASGGSIGREGPMVQLSVLCSSLLGQWRNWSVPQRRLILACGAAAGIASAYNAPIAGALFVSEIVLGSISMETFGPLVFASVLATQTLHYMRDAAPLYGIPHFVMESGWELFPYCALSLLLGLAAPWYLRTLRWSERLFGLVQWPPYVRIGVGGLVVGLLAVSAPEVCGNGYSVVNSILQEQFVWRALAVILLMKVVATCATFGSGAVGGVFTPTLFVGASLGYLFGAALAAVWPGPMPTPGAFALAGMAMFLAAATHAPLMAIIMVFEMTLDYQIILPLMLGCVLAFYTSQAFEARSLYTGAMERKGATFFAQAFAHLTVGDLMKRDPVRVLETARFSEIAREFIAHTFKYLYVVTPEGHYAGAVALQDVKAYLNMPELADLVIAREIAHDVVSPTTPGVNLQETLGLFARHDGERLPVVNNETERCLIGSVSKSDVILALSEQTKTG